MKRNKVYKKNKTIKFIKYNLSYQQFTTQDFYSVTTQTNQSAHNQTTQSSNDLTKNHFNFHSNYSG
jgi:uncharacterized membrane protein